MCLEGSQDFEDDRDCNLSPNLLRKVEQDKKQILPYKESEDIVSLEEEKEVKIRAYITTKTKQTMRFRYCWSTIEGDCISYIKKCRKCQIYGDKIHLPPSSLYVMTSL
ncbi:hypothetical protein J1N35_025430 [Gossypium stocksii]|uniref:Integrase zinc-binding domain-containing protein n=1 Tax=Gossypium stocksii TaxID=47602 RepID=A0A9D3V6K5_9ROSI|nr:hypothetical protein J1N35_025430 [Gossypium stocksii]